jgi:hypothetical protein
VQAAAKLSYLSISNRVTVRDPSYPWV